MLSYKSHIMPNLGVFFRHKNTIDVFIEDNYDEEFYKVLMNRVLSESTYKLDKLIPLGGKKNVIDACKADQLTRKQKRIYIVDGDLELITDNNEKELNYLSVLSKYCIENHLIDEEAIIEILHDFILIDKGKIKKQLSFENWLKGLTKPLIELFINYSICKKYSPTTQTVAFGVGKLCSEVKGIPVLDESKVNDRINDIKSEILKIMTEEEYNDIIYELRTKWSYTIENLIKIVSGKDCLIPLIEFRLHKFKKTSSFSIKRETLRMRLAKLTDISDLKADIKTR